MNISRFKSYDKRELRNILDDAKRRKKKSSKISKVLVTDKSMQKISYYS